MIKIQGHRGYSELYPENTMLAFQKCYESGAYGIETDVRKTADGEFILIHDNTVNRTTNGTGLVSAMTYDSIYALDAGSWKSAEFANRPDCKIPKLDDLLNEYRYKDIMLILHLYIDIEDITAVIDKIALKGMVNRVHVFGNVPIINEAKAYNPNLFTMNAGMATLATYSDILQNAITYNHNAVSINAIASDSDLQTMIQDIKSSGKLVHASYLSYSYGSYLSKHINLGTDFILGNNPTIMQSYVDNLQVQENTGLVKVNNFVKVTNGLVKATTYEQS